MPKLKTNEENNFILKLKSKNNDEIQEGEYKIYFSLLLQNLVCSPKTIEIKIINYQTLIKEFRKVYEIDENTYNCKDKYIEEYLKKNNHDFDKTWDNLISDKKIN